MPAVYKKIILVFLTAFALNPSHNSFAKWVFISDDNIGNQYYYEDTKTVKDLISEEISAWLLISYAETMQAPDGQSILSVIQDVFIPAELAMKAINSSTLAITPAQKAAE